MVGEGFGGKAETYNVTVMYTPLGAFSTVVVLAVAIIGGFLAPGLTASARAVVQADETPLYLCVDGTDAEAALVGARLCDAEPTPTLTSRAEEDRLQVREGALVTTLDTPSISRTAGLTRDDVIYRVGGVDVDTAEAAAEQLALVKTNQDTVVNFLRHGRPYRLTLRQ